MLLKIDLIKFDTQKELKLLNSYFVKKFLPFL